MPFVHTISRKELGINSKVKTNSLLSLRINLKTFLRLMYMQNIFPENCFCMGIKDIIIDFNSFIYKLHSLHINTYIFINITE